VPAAAWATESNSENPDRIPRMEIGFANSAKDEVDVGVV